MHHTKAVTQIRHNLPRYLFLAAGVSGLLFFAAIDFLHHGMSHHIGTDQMAGLVISLIIVMAALHTTESPHAKTWFGTLLLIYLAGILFMGLKPAGHLVNLHKGLLITTSPPVLDFIVNILGFIPFAYLHMAYRLSTSQTDRTLKTSLIVLAVGTGTSLFLELAQVYIPGRTSSLIDMIANVAGTLLGILYFLLSNCQSPTRQSPVQLANPPVKSR